MVLLPLNAYATACKVKKELLQAAYTYQKGFFKKCASYKKFVLMPDGKFLAVVNGKNVRGSWTYKDCELLIYEHGKDRQFLQIVQADKNASKLFFLAHVLKHRATLEQVI